jgi:homoserine dehydrogenase
VEDFVQSTETSREHSGTTPKLRVALVGFGTVGRSVAKLLCEDRADKLHLSLICNRRIERKKVDWVPAHVHWTESIEEVMSADVDIVVELVGGLEPAGNLVRRALRAGKAVVTANKHLIAECGPELLELARQKGCRIEFGASVAGGIPVLVGLQEGLAGDRLRKIAGILNGTCNYILSRMEASAVPFSDALREAQDLGFAEADPKEDLEGFDARAKLVILARVGLQCQIRSEQVMRRSISSIEEVDFVYARELGCTIRQIALAEKDSSNALRLLAVVQPALIPVSSLLAHVQGNQNLIIAAGELGGETIFSGCGAGGDPTAVAVVSDLLSIARRPSSLACAPPALEFPQEVSGELTVPHYVRFTVKDRPGIIAAVATTLARHGINIDAVLQKPGYPHSRLPFVITLNPCSTLLVDAALQQICEYDFHVQPPVRLSILTG